MVTCRYYKPCRNDRYIRLGGVLMQRLEQNNIVPRHGPLQCHIQEFAARLCVRERLVKHYCRIRYLTKL